MTTDNQKNYEEAANAAFPLDPHLVGTGHNSRMQDKRIGFLAGASFAEKEAHNAAIDKALKLLSEYIALVLFEKELEKLKI